MGEFYPHEGISSGLQPSCKACILAQSKAWYQANKDKKNAATREWQAANPEKVAKSRRDQRLAKPEDARAATKKWMAANRPAVNAYKRAYRYQNPAAVAKHELRRRAAERQAKVAWGDAGLIGDIYRLARIASACTGIKFEVDHVLPLRGRKVSGLHVEHNLTVITRHDNAVKSNRTE